MLSVDPIVEITSQHRCPHLFGSFIKTAHVSAVHVVPPCAPNTFNIAGIPTASLVGILQVFDSLDKDGSGYVDEREWRRLTEDTPLAASDDTFLFVQRVGVLQQCNGVSCVLVVLPDASALGARGILIFPSTISSCAPLAAGAPPGTRRENFNRGSSQRSAPVRWGC